MNINLQLIHALLAFDEHQTIQSAARSLGVSQPTLTRWLQEMDTLSSTRLFQMQGRKKKLTPYARGLVKGLKEQMQGLESFYRSYVLQGEKIEEQLLRGGGRPEILTSLFGTINTSQSLELFPLNSQLVLERLKSGELDFGLGTLTPKGTQWIARKLFGDEKVLIAPKSWLRKETKNLNFHEALSHLVKKPLAYYSRTVDFKTYEKSATPKFIVQDWRLIVKRVQSSINWSVVPSSFLPEDARVITIPVPESVITPIYLIYRIELRGHPLWKELANQTR